MGGSNLSPYIRSIAEPAREITSYSLPDGGLCSLLKRKVGCLRINPQEPRPYLVVIGGPDDSTDNIVYNEVTFHLKLGGKDGAMERLSAILEKHDL